MQNKSELDYHKTQKSNPYESTIKFFEFLEGQVDFSSHQILDAACGEGANLQYLTKNYKTGSLYGFDFDGDAVKAAQKDFENFSNSISIFEGDIYNLSTPIKSVNPNGITFLQTLSWLNDWKAALKSLSDLSPEWIALSSLFYEGRLEATIDIKRYDEEGNLNFSSPYNVYSLFLVEKYLRELGYQNFVAKPFIIQTNLEVKDKNNIGTFTKKLEDGTNLQFSGPILMPWYFIFASK